MYIEPALFWGIIVAITFCIIDIYYRLRNIRTEHEKLQRKQQFDIDDLRNFFLNNLPKDKK